MKAQGTWWRSALWGVVWAAAFSITVAEAASISGTLTYSGSQNGTIYAAVFTSPLSCTGPNREEPYAIVQLSGLGNFTIPNLPNGSYYVACLMFTEGPDGDLNATDPWAIHNGCDAITPIVISGDNSVTDKNLALGDATLENPNPFYIEEKRYHLVVTGNANGTIDFIKTIDELWFTGFSVTGDGGGRYSGDQAIVPFATHAPPLAYLPPEVGQSWNNTGESNGYPVNSTTTVDSVDQTLSTPAGTFHNCAYVVENLAYPEGYPPGQPQPPVKFERWFCPGIGPVKVIVTDSSPHTGELISHANITADSDDYFPLAANFSWTFRMDDGRQSTWVVSAPVVIPVSMDITGSFAPNAPVTITATASNSVGGTVYYKFYYCANYGTSAYDTSPWVVMQEYSTNASCTYTFPSQGSYIVVVRTVADPNNEPTDVPIIGGVVTIGDTATPQITLLSSDADGAVLPNAPVTYTIEADATGGAVYYKWFYRNGYGTTGYETMPWVVMKEYSTETSCEFKFPQEGSYIIVARAVADPTNEPADLPIIGATIVCNMLQ